MRGDKNPAFLKLSPTPREFQTRKISPFRFRPGAKENGQNFPGKILSRPVNSAGERDRKALENAFCRAYSLCACLPKRLARISRSEILLAPGGFDERREFPDLGPAQGPHDPHKAERYNGCTAGRMSHQYFSTFIFCNQLQGHDR